MTFSLTAEATETGLIHLEMVIDGDVVWPHPHADVPGSDFDPEDVVAWLVDAWSSLLLERVWPIQFQPELEPRSMTGLLRAAEDRWETFGSADAHEVSRENARIDAFLYAHDFRQMKHGAGLNACFALRQHTRIRIETNGSVYDEADFRVFMAELTKLGKSAAKLISKRTDKTAKFLIERWEHRNDIDPLDAAALLSGLSRTDIEASEKLSRTFRATLSGRNLLDVANDNLDPIPAAARASGALGPAGLAEIVGRIEAIPDGSTTLIASQRLRLQRGLRDTISPLDQGIRAASLVREWMKLAPHAPIDLADLSSRLGILVERHAIPDPRLDGIATIGPQHGPAIILNENTRRQGAGAEDLERSLGFTWAHEIGHLLLDHDEWAALVDATRQRVSRSKETRANAFATYLLLPQGAADAAWEREGEPEDWPRLEVLLNQLTETYGLPRIAASRQLAREVPYDRRSDLEQIFRIHVDHFETR